ncbi:Acid sphingomyelinase-like phosphodiesterase 3b [Sparganum proliferum]
MAPSPPGRSHLRKHTLSASAVAFSKSTCPIEPLLSSFWLDEPVLPLLFGPSISPWRLGGLGAFNPRVRVFEYSHSTLRLVDYHQFFLNLSAASEPTWTLEYSFREEYRLPDTGAVSLSALLTDFVHSEANWTRYWSHQLGGLPHASGDCPTLGSPRRCQHLCAMFCLSYADLDRCLSGCKADSPLIKLLPSAFPRDAGLATAAGDHMTEHWSPLPITVVVIVVFLAILLGVVLLVNRELCRRRRREHAGHLGSLFNANQNGYFGCSSASETGGRDIDRFTSLSLSRPSSLDGSLEVQADEGALIRSGGDAGRQTPLDRISGLVKFNRSRGSCDHNYHPHEQPVNSPRSKFASITGPAHPRLAFISGDDTFRSAGASMQGGPGSCRRASPDITDQCGEEDEGVEEGDYDNEDDNLELGLDYDAEGEDEEDLFFRPPVLPSAPVAANGNRLSMNLKPLRGLISDLPSRLNGRCLLTTSTSIAPAQRGQSATSPTQLPPTQDEVHDLSDAEYYSIHSSLQYLHPGGGGGARGSASPDSMMASTIPPSQSACGVFRYAPPAAGTAATCDSCSTVDGETPSSGSLGGSLDSSSTSAASKREPAPTGGGLSSTNGESGRSHATPSTASTSFISSAPSNIFPVVGTAPGGGGGGVVGSAAEA